jgi:hypothetical protein
MDKVIQGIVNLSILGLDKLPDFLKDVVVKKGYFACNNNFLTTLEGTPKEVEGYFDCSCNFLTNLEGAPNVVKGNFYCTYNPLTSLEGLPKEIGGYLYISFAPGISFTGEEIRKVSNIKGDIHFIKHYGQIRRATISCNS